MKDENEQIIYDLLNRIKVTDENRDRMQKIRKYLDESKYQEALEELQILQAFGNVEYIDYSEVKEKEQKIKPSYNDRSYGIPLMVGMIIFLTVPYFLISIILALFNGVNAILEEISTFGKIARYIVLSILIVAVALLIIYCGILGGENLFNVKILPIK